MAHLQERKHGSQELCEELSLSPSNSEQQPISESEEQPFVTEFAQRQVSKKDKQTEIKDTCKILPVKAIQIYITPLLFVMLR